MHGYEFMYVCACMNVGRQEYVCMDEYGHA